MVEFPGDQTTIPKMTLGSLHSSSQLSVADNQIKSSNLENGGSFLHPLSQRKHGCLPHLYISWKRATRWPSEEALEDALGCPQELQLHVATQGIQGEPAWMHSMSFIYGNDWHRFLETWLGNPQAKWAFEWKTSRGVSLAMITTGYSGNFLLSMMRLLFPQACSRTSY